MIVAVTGGTGFIGRKLVEHLLAQDNTVRLLTRRNCAMHENISSLEMHECDLLTADVDELSSILNGVDVLYHCAGQIRDVRTMRALHIDATRRLVKAAAGRVRRWVQLSSVGVYGPVFEGTVTENSALAPKGEYEITKSESDLIVIEAARKGGFEYSILRPSNVYGVGMTNQSLYGLIAMVRRKLFFFIGKPGALANYIHVDNVAEALMSCGTMPQADSQVFNLSDCRTMEQFISIIAESLGQSVPRARVPEFLVRSPAKVLKSLPGFPLTGARVDALTGCATYSTEKIERKLGYRHRVSMEKGLQELVGYWREVTGK